jgi:hypothetical protein
VEALVESVGEVACALCTAASKHPAALALALELLGQLLGASQMSEEQKEHAARGFQHAQTALDPLMKVKGLAEGLSGKREQELMEIREAIACEHGRYAGGGCAEGGGCCDAAVLDYCERLDAHGKVQSLSNFEDLGLVPVLRVATGCAVRVRPNAELGGAPVDCSISLTGATYERGQFEQLHIKAKGHMRIDYRDASYERAAEVARKQPGGRSANRRTLCRARSLKMQPLVQARGASRAVRAGEPERLPAEARYGQLHRVQERGVRVLHDRFLPKGSVPLNVLVSMCTNYRLRWTGRRQVP